MLDYSEYKSFVETLEQSNHENTYEEVMRKEEKVLDTMNRVIRYHRDIDLKDKQFMNLPVAVAVQRFFMVLNDIFSELVNGKYDSLSGVFTKGDRLIYIGALLILLSIFIYYVEITRS